MLPVKAPRDPAPSRVKYRLERLWLRPAIRNFVRAGIPAIVVSAIVLTLASDPAVQAEVGAQAKALRDRIAAHPSLMIEDLDLPDASPVMAERIRSQLDLNLPTSSMDMDLGVLQDRVAELDAVASAHVRLQAGGVLEIRVTEKVPALVWRSAEGHQLLDKDGGLIGPLPARTDRADLPLVTGPGADRAAAEAMDLLRLAGPIADRVRGVQRVGERRWTLVLNRDQQIMLPEAGAAAALSRILALHAGDKLLDRDIQRIDFRDGRRPILRVSPYAMTEVKRGRGVYVDEDI